MAPKRICKDCGGGARPAPHPGPRCATHHRERRTELRESSWERRLISTYGITAEEYWNIYRYQGGSCYICRRAKGTGRKRLSVDHDHKTGYTRGLLCGPCNLDVLGHLRDEPEAFLRGFNYLKNSPAFSVIGKRIAPGHYQE